MVITENKIKKDYNRLCKIAHYYCNKKNYELAILYMQKAAMLMYNSNLFYVDNDLEELLRTIAINTINKKTNVNSKSNKKIKVVFYDFFVLDNRGLTEQYLDFFFNTDKYDVLFIGCNEKEKESIIYSKLSNHNIPYIIIQNNNELIKSQNICNFISTFSPEIIIAHTSPFDIAGLMAISLFENKCRRYLINITDHAFWLGTKVFDYFFEFRDYGYNISKKYRGIDDNKLLKLPYYPIINKSVPFEGFDFDIEGKKLIVSGGSIYKIEGSPVFFEIVKHILVNHKDTIFLYLGSGNTDYINDFINKNAFQDRFFLRPERKDIYEVFKHCYFYLNTYPLSGGLMTQYACITGKIPITFRDSSDPESNINELFIKISNSDFQFSDLNLLKLRIDNYLDNPALLENDSLKIEETVINHNQFNSTLSKYLSNPKNAFPVQEYEIDIKRFYFQYLKRFNDDKSSYYKIFINKNLITLPFFFSYYLRLFLEIIVNSLQKK